MSCSFFDGEDEADCRQARTCDLSAVTSTDLDVCYPTRVQGYMTNNDFMTREDQIVQPFVIFGNKMSYPKSLPKHQSGELTIFGTVAYSDSWINSGPFGVTVGISIYLFNAGTIKQGESYVSAPIIAKLSLADKLNMEFELQDGDSCEASNSLGSCEPFLTLNMQTFRFEVNGDLTDTAAAVGDYEFNVFLESKGDNSLKNYAYSFTVTIESDSTTLSSPPINITHPWPEFYRNNKGQIPYRMTQPSVIQLEEELLRA